MPLLILSGYPCSGLTYRAHQLHALLEQAQDTLFATGAIPASKSRYKVVTVSTHDASDQPHSVYDNARSEKMARAVAFARAKRALGRDTFVILDGMNYIKGVRYQLWCEAKAVGTTCCVVHVGTPVEKCVANNEERLRRKAGKQDQSEGAQEADPDAEPYTPELLDNLIFRYEEPSTHSRWDKPLFTIPWVDAEPPIADIWTALTGIVHPSSTDPNTTPSTPTISNPNTTTQNPTSDTASVATAGTSATGGGFRAATRPKIKPHAATLQPSATNSSALYDLEKRTSAVISAIRTFTLANPSASALLATNSSTATATATESSSSSPSSSQEPGISIPIPDCSAPIFIPAHIAALGSTDELAGAGGVLALPRLQRLKRQWIGLNRAYIGGNYAVGTGLGGLRGDEVGDAFVRFLNAEFGGVV